jgi:unsaturated rhamnogalacturonyl hydrolase
MSNPSPATNTVLKSTGIAALALFFGVSCPAAEARPARVLLDNFYNHETKDGKRYHYTWDDKASSGFSKLGALFTAETSTTFDHLTVAPTEENLRAAAVYIIVDPDTENEAANHAPHFVDAAAAEAVVRWVKAGGTLVLMNNAKEEADREHLNLLAERFGITFNHDLRNQTPARNRQLATVDTQAATHPIFREVPSVYLKEICTLRVRPPATAILSAPKETGEGADVIMATSQLGKGRVFAVGDPWLYNEYINTQVEGRNVANQRAAANLVRWLLSQPTAAQPRTP